MTSLDTIAAVATPPGHGAIAIVRSSGPGVRDLAARVFRSRRPIADRVATYGTVLDLEGRSLDRGLALFMAAPHTYTGEDTLELHVHGSPVVARETLRALLAAGARHAGPGEFTRRAFLNGKLDLTAAEAVADVIAAESRSAARAAAARLGGALSTLIGGLGARLSSLLEELAGAIDFPDEVPEPERGRLASEVGAIAAEAATLLRTWEVGRLVREGVGVAIVGPPNAGKSSLLNALLGEERALVSDLPGTTRDTIEETILVDGVRVRLVDTAGIRGDAQALEAQGIARAERELEAARLALVVVDGSAPLGADAREVLVRTRSRTRLVLFNKRDAGTEAFAAREPAEADALSVSVRITDDLARVRAALGRALWGDAPDFERPHLASARQADAVTCALRALERALITLQAGEPVDFMTGDLLEATAAFAAITGAAATEALLDGIFARFCIGK